MVTDSLFEQKYQKLYQSSGIISTANIINLVSAMKVHIFLFVLLLASFFQQDQAILNDVHDAIGWSNVDLVNFQYFKNLPSQDPKRAAQANLFLEHFQKKKAILDYFENLFLGNSPFTQESEIPFDPHFGRAWRPYYVRKFGWKGERLIDALGKGYSVKQLKHFGAIPKDYGSRYYPS